MNFEPLAVGDELPRDRDVAQQHLMRRLLVVEAETVAGVTDLIDAGLETDKLTRAGPPHRRLPTLVVSGAGRILRERMQDVGQNQLLMLLLVMQTDLDDRDDFFQQRFVGAFDQHSHRAIDMRAIGRDLLRHSAA